MNLEKRLSMSFYQTVATLNEVHKIFLVQHSKTKKIYVKKILDVYNKSLYESLMANPIPSIPQIFELYEEDNTLTIIEEYISGNTIAELLESNHKFSPEQISDIIIRLCDILGKLHACTPPIIHRDVKPSNIILTPTGEIYLIDFNAAKYESHEKNEDTTLLGTKGYAAPEQYGFGVSNPQTDIYAIGMLINTMVEGHFTPSLSEDKNFSFIIKKCTELRPCDRYESVDEVKKQLQGKRNTPKGTISHISGWQSFLPPGFRTGKAIKMIPASIVYLFLGYICLTMNIKNVTSFELEFERIGLLLFFLIFIFVLFNYQGIANLFPLSRSDNFYIKVLGHIIFATIVSLIYFFVFLLVVSICRV